jgi:hypothetical protein
LQIHSKALRNQGSFLLFIIYYSANPDLNTPSEFFTDFFSLLTNIEKKQKKTFEIGKPWAEKKPGFVHLNNIVGTKLLRLEIFVAQGQALFIHFFCNNYLRTSPEIPTQKTGMHLCRLHLLFTICLDPKP